MCLWGVLREDDAGGSLHSVDAYCEWPERDIYCEIHSRVGYDTVRVIVETFTIEGVPIEELLPFLLGISQGAVQLSAQRFGGQKMTVTGINGRKWVGV
jgi:hypothetical protein